MVLLYKKFFSTRRSSRSFTKLSLHSCIWIVSAADCFFNPLTFRAALPLAAAGPAVQPSGRAPGVHAVRGQELLYQHPQGAGGGLLHADCAPGAPGACLWHSVNLRLLTCFAWLERAVCLAAYFAEQPTESIFTGISHSQCMLHPC